MNFTHFDKEKLANLVNNLENYKQKLEKINYTHDKKEFFEVMTNFRRYLLSADEEGLYEVFFHSKHFRKYKDFFTNINNYYLRMLESLQSISIMTRGIHNYRSFSDIIDKDLIKESYEKKAKEIESIDFSEAKQMILVWCGPMPETLLYMYENTNIDNIVGIDNNHEAVFIAGEMINGLNLDKISLYQADGTRFNYKNADIVYLPIFAYPKNKIIKRIVETGKESVQILVNSPVGLANLMYEDFWKIHPRLKIEYRSDSFSSYLSQEVVKLVKYDF